MVRKESMLNIEGIWLLRRSLLIEISVRYTYLFFFYENDIHNMFDKKNVENFVADKILKLLNILSQSCLKACLFLNDS